MGTARTILLSLAGLWWAATIVSFTASSIAGVIDIHGCHFEYGWYCGGTEWQMRLLQLMLNFYLLTLAAPFVLMALLRPDTALHALWAIPLILCIVVGTILLVLKLPRVLARLSR